MLLASVAGLIVCSVLAGLSLPRQLEGTSQAQGYQHAMCASRLACSVNPLLWIPLLQAHCDLEQCVGCGGPGSNGEDCGDSRAVRGTGGSLSVVNWAETALQAFIVYFKEDHKSMEAALVDQFRPHLLTS